eukprot:GHRR01009821.1.p1 GENE.GHRR01009821.1~~GHRR01009821.1.p1  ORF type:complete len:412 (+),score=95.87 GHRR01009821.1:55-1290(+)
MNCTFTRGESQLSSVRQPRCLLPLFLYRAFQSSALRHLNQHMEGTVVHQLGGDGSVMDACYTLSGNKVATCSDTGTVQVWSCKNDQREWELLHVEELPEQPTQLTWAYPEHGLVLAIGTNIGSVHILQGPAPNISNSSSIRDGSQPQHTKQQRQYSDGWGLTGRLHCGQGAVSALAFAPRQHGLVLAVGSQDRAGTIAAAAAAAPQLGGGSSVVLYEAAGVAATSLRWTLLGKLKLPGNAGCCRCLCWREACPGLPPLFVLGHGKGGMICAYNHNSMGWRELCHFASPTNYQQPLIAVHWAPAVGRPMELLAASYGKIVVLYAVSVPPNSRSAAGNASDELLCLEVEVLCEMQHPEDVWKLEFNMMGNTLACSLEARPEVWFWHPNTVDGPWRPVTKLVGKNPAELDSMVD